MAAFEDLSRRFARSRRASDAAAEIRGELLLDKMIVDGVKAKLGYPSPKAAQEFYQTTTDDFERLALKMAAATRANANATFDRPQAANRTGAAPRPKMRARLRPLADTDPRSEIAEMPDPRP